MKYQMIKELSPDCLVMKAEDEREAILEKIEFPVMPRESLRLDLQRELKGVIRRESELTSERLVKYSGLEKYEGQLYLVREADSAYYLEPFAKTNPERIVQALLEILKIIRRYHSQGLVLGGLSLGLLKQDPAGEFYLQDPLVYNYLSKLLPEDYRIDSPPEVIRGGEWTEKSDLFSWGLLAYRLLSGEDPFVAGTPEERIAKILKIGAAPLKDLRPELNQDLSRLVMSCLDGDPQKRVELAEIESRLLNLLQEGKLTVSESEAGQYRERALVNLKRHKTKERFQLWMRKYGFAALIAAVGFFITLGLFFMGSGTKPVITAKNKPLEVLNYYFQGVRELNVSLVDETLHHAKNSYADMVTNLYVINKAQQGMTYTQKNNIQLDFLDLKIKPLTQTSGLTRFRAEYTLRITLPKEIQYFQRLDEYTLEPVSKVWRIVKINVLNEKKRTETLPEQTASPENGLPAPPASPGSSGGASN